MRCEITVSTAHPDGRVFVNWAPVGATAKILDPVAGTGPIQVTIRSAGTLGRLVFADTRTDQGTPSLSVALPRSGGKVKFFVAGQFGFPSTSYGDAVIEAIAASTSEQLASVPVMVRIRKNANQMAPPERDRFVAAFGTLNGNGIGRFKDFRGVHVGPPASDEAHFARGFLPWHRAYLLDLERELQAIDPTVALPYWRFDQAAPNVFTPDFMGLPDNSGVVQFSPGHPFTSWSTDGAIGIDRAFRTFTPGTAPPLRSELSTIALGGNGNTFEGFTTMEGDPHGSAHTSFQPTASIFRIPSAARDPLFFLLHANVDRLWAKWQWVKRRTNPTLTAAFPTAPPARVGHNLADTMWPWNLVVTPPRPIVAPGGALAPSLETPLPGASPTVASMIDHLGVHDTRGLGFAYDDVPFELETLNVS